MTQRRAAKNSRMCLFTASGASICTQWFASSTYLLKQTRTELNEVGGQEKGCCRIIKPKRYFLFYSKAILHKRIFKFIPRVLYAINEVCCHHALWTDSSKEKYKQTTNKRKRNQVLASLLRSRSLSRHATLLPTNVGRSVAWRDKERLRKCSPTNDTLMSKSTPHLIVKSSTYCSVPTKVSTVRAWSFFPCRHKKKLFKLITSTAHK